MSNVEYFGKRLSLFNIARYMLEYDKITEDIHKRWCDEFEETLKYHNRIVRLKPRGTYKTTIYSVAFAIDRLIQDYVDNNGVFTKRILIASATNDAAEQILYEIKQHLTDSVNLKKFFDPYGNKKIISKENQQEVILHPRKVKKEPNLKARGALSNIVSEHYDIIICDDLVNADDRESASIREKKKRWLQDLISILEPDGLLIIIGTRWHDDDVYNYIFNINSKLTGSDRYDIEIDSVMDSEGNPKYPTIYDKEKIEALKIEKGLIEFWAQYMNEPLPGETQLFNVENFHFYDDKSTFQERINNPMFNGCEHFMYVDPALGKSNDYCIAIVGAIKDHVLYIREVWMSNVTSPENSIKKIEFLCTQYDCAKIGVESNGFQSLFTKRLKEIRRENKGHVKIDEIKNYRNKRVRIESVEPFVTSGKVMFRRDWMDCYPEFINQIVRYPVHKHDDAPDALEGIVRMTINRAASFKNSKSKKMMVGANRNSAKSSVII